MITRHYFASANTNKKFVNFFDYICQPLSPFFTYVLKGGSGSGKSTLMKKVAKHFSEKDYDLEFFYCSSDPNSLDGIRIVPYNICLVDGTAPHVTEAKIPAVVDKIINLGEFIDDGVQKYKNEITEILKEKQNNYASIYAIISAIGNLDQIIRKNYLNYNNKDVVECILSNCSYSHKQGNLRKLFLTALDENGITDLTKKNNFTEIYLPLNKYEFGEIVDLVKNKILNKGNDLTIFFDIFDCDKALGLLVNNKIFYTYSKEIALTQKEQQITSIIDELIKITGKLISETRKLHFNLEKYYYDFIDFGGLDNAYEQLKADIEKRIDKIKNFN